MSEYKLFTDSGDDFNSAFTQISTYDGSASIITLNTTDTPLFITSGKVYRFVYVATNTIGDSDYS